VEYEGEKVSLWELPMSKKTESDELTLKAWPDPPDA
jgi:hypothetical protein